MRRILYFLLVLYGIGIVVWFEFFFWLAVGLAGLVLACAALIALVNLVTRLVLPD